MDGLVEAYEDLISAQYEPGISREKLFQKAYTAYPEIAQDEPFRVAGLTICGIVVAKKRKEEAKKTDP